MLFTGLFAALSTTVANAEEHAHPGWTIGVGGGIADQYSFWTRDYGFGTYSERTRSGWLASASLQRALSNSVALRGEVSYLRYSGEFAVASINPPTPRGVRVAEIPALALGVRLRSGRDSGRRGSVFLDLMPAVVVAHWTEGVMHGDEWGSRERKTKVATGVIMRAGMLLPIGGGTSVEFGPRYTRTGPSGWTQFE